MVLIPEIRSIDFSIPISSVSSILFLVEPKRTGYKFQVNTFSVRRMSGRSWVSIKVFKTGGNGFSPLALRIMGIARRLARQCRDNGVVKYWLKNNPGNTDWRIVAVKYLKYS